MFAALVFVQVVVLGSASEPAVQSQWEAMARELGNGPDARIIMRFDEGLAHRIYAGELAAA